MTSTLSIKALRTALTQHGVSFAGCVEKHELIALLVQAEAAASAPAEPSAKRPRTCPVATASDAGSAAETNRGSELRQLLIGVLPAPERRLKEPDPALLFAPHHIPLASTCQLRVCTFNLLDDVRVSNGHGGIHSVWDVRRINLLRCLLSLDADVYLCRARRDFHPCSGPHPALTDWLPVCG